MDSQSGSGDVKYKNLLFVHLESISNTILWQYRVELGTVWRLMQGSRRFTRFFSGATSTAMAKCDLWDGSSARYDSLPIFEMDLPGDVRDRWNKRNIFRAAEELGGHLPRILQINYYHQQFTSGQGMTQNVHSKEGYVALAQEHMQEALRLNRPFFLYLMNLIPHMAMDDEAKMGAKSFSDRFRQGYLSMDGTLNQILAALLRLGQWDKTLIVGFGDHGDEMWSHGLNRGYSHGIAPYASLCWTPLFIFDNGEGAGDDDRLISLIDVKDMILDRLFAGTVSEEKLAEYRAVAFPGINPEKVAREFAFTQNLFALQLEYTDPEQGMTKNYSVTDGVYRLLVASGGKRPKDGGLEFFYDRLDPANSRNLLDFFKLNYNGDIIGYYPPPDAVDPDFSLAFNPEAVAHMTEAYDKLKKALYEYVRAKEAEALKVSYPQKHIMPDAAFRHARKRLRKDYQE